MIYTIIDTTLVLYIQGENIQLLAMIKSLSVNIATQLEMCVITSCLLAESDVVMCGSITSTLTLCGVGVCGNSCLIC